MRTRAGLTVFTRERIELRKPAGPMSHQSRITGCSIHHGGPVGGPRWTFAKAAETWRQWQAYHIGKGWSDIGYCAGIDARGRIYLGRPFNVVPAAVGGHNTGIPGIVFLQDGRYHALTFLQRKTLRILFEKGIPELGLPPLKTLEVKGHQEYSSHESNSCPGAKIMKHLRWRRRRY